MAAFKKKPSSIGAGPLIVIETLVDGHQTMEIADRDSLYTPAHHPYTQALLSAVPVTDPDEPKSRIELDPARVNREAPLREIAAGHVAAV